jgi:hypothetical protein
LVLAALCLPAVACAQAKTTFLFDDAGAEGGALAKTDAGDPKNGSSASETDCASFCDVAAEKGVACDDVDACNAACKASKKVADGASCSDEWQALLDCAVGSGTGGKAPVITCNSAGAASIANCTSKNNALNDCVEATPPPETETDSGPSPGSCTLLEPVDSDPTCNTCAEQHCCADWNACTNSADCTAFYDCVGACPTGSAEAACIDACGTSHPTGHTVALTALNCTQASCATPCGL